MFRTRALIAVAVAAALSCIGWAAPVPVPAAAKDPPADTARRALHTPISVDANASPLATVLEQLGDQAKVNLILDRGVLMQQGIEPNELAVTSKLKDVKLRDGLRTILTPLGLSHVIVGDSILITSEEQAVQRQLRQRIDVDVMDQPFSTALRQLARRSGVNLLLDARAVKQGQEKVTLELEDVPLETAVRLMAELAGLRVARIGNVLFVSTDDRVERLKADASDLAFTPPSLLGPDRVIVPPAVPLPVPLAQPAAVAPVPAAAIQKVAPAVLPAEVRKVAAPEQE